MVCLIGDAYYRFSNHRQSQPDSDYPKDLRKWDQRWLNLDAAFQYNNRKTYFFQGRGYYVFDDNAFAVRQLCGQPTLYDCPYCVQ